MISKVICAAISAYNAGCRYLFKDGKDAQIISSKGVRHDPALMASDFMTYGKQRPNKTKSMMFHGILSFPQGEKISDIMAFQISSSYLNSLGFSASAHVVVAHREKKNFHLHCLSSFVDMDGRQVNDSWIGLRAKKVAQELTKKYELTPAIQKNYANTNFANFRNHDKEKYRLHVIIGNAIKISHSMNLLEVLLKEKNIEVQYKIKSQSQEIQGISFKSEDFCFKGSEIDRNFSYKKILKSIELNVPHEVNAIESKIINNEKESSALVDFISLFGGSGGNISGALFPVSSPIHNAEDDDEKKKKKKKRKPNEYKL